MPEKKLLKLEIYSRLDLTDTRHLQLRDDVSTGRTNYEKYLVDYKKIDFFSKAGERLLNFIRDYNSGLFLPEKCDVYEPIKEVFNPKDLSSPIRWLSQVGGRVMLKKMKPFKYEGFVENMRHTILWTKEKNGAYTIMKRHPDPVFLTQWCFWFDTKFFKKTTLNDIQNFFKELYLMSNADYGFLALEDEHKSKNYLVKKLPNGSSSKFVGNNLEECLPGVYWINILGKSYVEWFGEDKFKKLPAAKIERLNEGSYMFWCSDDPEYYKGAMRKDIETISLLGAHAFFDINNPERECLTP